MKVSMFYLPSTGSRSDVENGMAGTKPELYRRMLDEVAEQARLGDDLGLLGAAPLSIRGRRR